MTASTSASRAGPFTVVLVVEDEPLQRMSLVDMLGEAGYGAVEATDADGAIAILERRTDIQIVLVDIEMPGSLDGLRLAAAVRGRWPPIEIILTTAGRPPLVDSLPARAVFLPKPLNRTRVRKAVEAFAA